MNDYNEFMSIVKMNASLIKKRTIYDRNIFTIFYIYDYANLIETAKRIHQKKK